MDGLVLRLLGGGDFVIPAKAGIQGVLRQAQDERIVRLPTPVSEGEKAWSQATWRSPKLHWVPAFAGTKGW